MGSNFDGAPDLEFRLASKALGPTVRPELSAHPARLPVPVRPHAQGAGGGVRGRGRERTDEARRRDRRGQKWDVVRVPPGTWRGYEAGPEGLEILVFGAPNLGENPREDVEGHETGGLTERRSVKWSAVPRPAALVGPGEPRSSGRPPRVADPIRWPIHAAGQCDGRATRRPTRLRRACRRSRCPSRSRFPYARDGIAGVSGLLAVACASKRARARRARYPDSSERLCS